MLSLADAKKKLDTLKATGNTKATIPKPQDLNAIQKKIEATRKKVELHKQSNADVLSEEDYSTSRSYSSRDEEDDDDGFLVRGYDKEREGPLANLGDSQSGYSDEEEDEEEEEDDLASMTLDSQSESQEEKPPVRPKSNKRQREAKEAPNKLLQEAGKQPRPSEQVRALRAERKANQKKQASSGGNKKAKTDVLLASLTEEMEREQRREQLSNTLSAQIREYEKLRQIASDALLQAQTEVVRLEEQERSLAIATVFVLDQKKLSEDYDDLKNKATTLAETERQLNVRAHELDEKEKEFEQKTHDVNQQFVAESGQKVQEIARATEELERKKEAFEKRVAEINQQQQQQQVTVANGVGSSTKPTNNLDAFIDEMHRINQNTVTKETFATIVPTVLMNNFATLALRPNPPTYKVRSTTNSQYIILDIESTEGVPLFRQVISKQIYTLK